MHWKQYQRFEQRGDLQKQAEGLTEALSNRLSVTAIQEALALARQSAQTAEQRQPSPVITFQDNRLCMINPYTHAIEEALEMPREAGQKQDALINWSHFNGPQVMGLNLQGKQFVPQDILSARDIPHAGLRLNSAYAYLPFSSLQGSMPRGLLAHHSYLCKQWIDPRIPLENLRSRPYDLAVSPQHPYFIVGDRSAGKLHFVQRNPFKLLRSWPLTTPPHKKVLQSIFHPDGQRVYVSTYQKGGFHIIDRAMAQKRIAVNTPGIVSHLALSSRGDLLYVYVVLDEQIEIWVLDTQKHQKQAVFSLEGSAFSGQTDPQDLFEISPDGRSLLTVVSRNRPNLFSPYLLQIECSSGQVIAETLLKPEEKPLQLAFMARALSDPKIRLLPIILHGGHGLEEADVKAAFSA
jgi:hypothetical protein